MTGGVIAIVAGTFSPRALVSTHRQRESIWHEDLGQPTLKALCNPAQGCLTFVGLPWVGIPIRLNPERAGRPRSVGSFRKEPCRRDMTPIFVFPFFRRWFLWSSWVLLVLRECQMLGNLLQGLREFGVAHFAKDGPVLGGNRDRHSVVSMLNLRRQIISRHFFSDFLPSMNGTQRGFHQRDGVNDHQRQAKREQRRLRIAVPQTMSLTYFI